MTQSPPDRLTWLGHSTVLLELSGTRCITDPLLRNRVGHLVRVATPVDTDALAGVDAVLISHLHRDHFDVPSLRRLPRTAQLVVPAGTGRLATRQGFRASTELAAGDGLRIGSVTVAAVPARHDGRRGRFGPAAETIGYVLSARSRVYFAGDTDVFDGMTEIAAGAPLDVGLLPVWGWGPTVGSGHLTPLRAARAVALLRPRIAIPIHWGTLYPIGLSRFRPDPLRRPPLEFQEHVRRLRDGANVRVLGIGEGMPVRASPPAAPVVRTPPR